MFVTIRNNLMKAFEEMTKDVNHLFEVNLDKDELYNLYLDSFPEGTNEVFREKRKHDCSACRSFIKTIGNAVIVKDKKVTSIWDFDCGDPTYQVVFDTMAEYVKSKVISDVYLSEFSKIGVLENYEETESGKPIKWEHYFVELPKKFVYKGRKSIGTAKGEFRDSKNVFKRSLEEFTLDALDTVLELIHSNTLYKGEEWLGVLTEFRKFKVAYDNITDETEKDLYAWETSVGMSVGITRIRNHSIGTLITNVSEGMDLELAVKKYEQIVAPSNYKRPKEIFTKKMLDEAKATIEELGYSESLERRFATLDDITVNNILFSNKDASKRIKGNVLDDIFDDMSKKVATKKPKNFSGVEEVSIDKFISDILPDITEMELYLENKHTSNLVSLIAPKNRDSRTMFKWANNFGWSYTGNVTDSMKELVKSFGGKVDGDLRFSIQWNEDGTDNCDLDAHCSEQSTGNEIYYASYRQPSFSPNKGQLDVDIITPDGKVAVENITYVDRKYMKDGDYVFRVHQFSGSARKGFRAEIEFDGKIYEFDYPNHMINNEYVTVATVTLKDGVFSIKEEISSSKSSKEVWNVSTNQFVPVIVLMNSPNYWDDQTGIGHKHYFFMLKDCINPERPNGFFNEYLKEELVEHKRVFAALGSKMRVEDVEDQLSGVGFSSTKRNEVTLKIKGNIERVIKVKF